MLHKIICVTRGSPTTISVEQAKWWGEEGISTTETIQDDKCTKAMEAGIVKVQLMNGRKF